MDGNPLRRLARLMRRAARRRRGRVWGAAWAALEATPAPVFTKTFRRTCLLEVACRLFSGFAVRMLELGAEPAPGLCGQCLIEAACGFLDNPDPPDCGTLVADLLRRGADANYVRYSPTALLMLCAWPRPPVAAIQALLEIPDVCLQSLKNGRPVEEGCLSPLVVAMVRETRAGQARWSGLRRAWVFAVVSGAGAPRPPPE